MVWAREPEFGGVTKRVPAVMPLGGSKKSIGEVKVGSFRREYQRLRRAPLGERV
jgi:hypothetical protein